MRLFGLQLCALVIAACGKAPPPPQDTGAQPEKPVEDVAAKAPAEDTAAAKTADTAAASAADAPAPDSAAMTQCKAIVAKAWGAVKPVVARLGVRGPELETRYTTDTRFLEACEKLAQDKRDCLAAAENPVAAIDTCEVNKPTRVLWPFDFGSDIALWPSTPLPAEEIDKLTAWLEGTWVSTWASLNETQRWVVGKGGKVESAEVTKDGQPRPDRNVPELLSFKDTGKLYVLWKGSTTTQTLAFFKESDDVFYASTNQLYDAYPVADEQHFTVRHNWEYIVFDHGRCEVIVGSGLALPATCEIAKDGDKRVFKTSYTRPGAARPSTMEHVIVNKHFLVDSMVEMARFVRQK